MSIKLAIIFIAGFLILYLNTLGSSSFAVQAQGFDVKLEQPKGYGIKGLIGNPGEDKGLSEGIVETILVNIITLFFSVGGIGVVIYFVWGAVDWILSGGDKEKVASARKKMTHAIIGLVLLSLSYVIINIVGQIVGFNPLGYLQLRGLGDTSTPTINQ